jgi:two-component system chemotaxis response regulator CheB
MIRTLIVDDSKVVQEFLTFLFSSDPEIKIVGVAGSGQEAIDIVKRKKPDVITMDIHMPGMDGYEATRVIMESIPTPIVIVSGSADSIDSSHPYRYIEVGALAFIHRPAGIGDPDYEFFSKELIQTVKLMSEVKVIKLYPISRKGQLNPLRFGKPVEGDVKRIQVVAIGASMGGPIALQKILSRLPEDLPVPVLIVQHIAAGFVKGFQEWLSLTAGIRLKIAEDEELLSPGVGYIAPDKFHMGASQERKIKLSTKPSENGLKPSVNWLFRSVTEVYGPGAMGVLLSGMGKDGAYELKVMKDKGALTIVQNEESSVMFGMPGEALLLGAADHAFSPERIAETIIKSCLKNI